MSDFYTEGPDPAPDAGPAGLDPEREAEIRWALRGGCAHYATEAEALACGCITSDAVVLLRAHDATREALARCEREREAERAAARADRQLCLAAQARADAAEARLRAVEPYLKHRYVCERRKARIGRHDGPPRDPATTPCTCGLDAILAAPAAEAGPCPRCGGSGSITVPEHARDCQGDCNNCPVQVEASCDHPSHRAPPGVVGHVGAGPTFCADTRGDLAEIRAARISPAEAGPTPPPVRLSVSREWVERKAREEGDGEVAAGAPEAGRGEEG